MRLLCRSALRTTLLLWFVGLVTAGISFSPSAFPAAEDGWFTVDWSGIPSPTVNDTNDILVLYATDENPVTIGAVAPISYIYPFLINETAWKLGQGSYKFYVPNYFSDIQAVYVRGGDVVPARSGIAPVADTPKLGTWMAQGTLKAAKKSLFRPVRKVLSFTNDASTVRITWSAVKARGPVVYFGTSPKSLKGAAAYVSSFNASDMCTPPATTLGYFSQGIQISAEMTDLLPNTRYYYRVGDLAYGFSTVDSFISPPKPGSDSSLKMFVLADHGAYNPDDSFYFVGGYSQDIAAVLPLPKPGFEMVLGRTMLSSGGLLFQNGGKIVAQEIEKRMDNKKHGIIINGDLSYAFGYTSRWAMWLNNFKKTFSSMPVLTSAGNHEADDPQLPLDAFDGRSFDSQGECAIPYYNLLRPPQANPFKYWYSADMGPVHFVQLSTEQIMAPGSEQYLFLEQDLMKVDRSVTPWVIVGWHRPQYLNQPNFSNITGDIVVAQKLVDEVEPLFAEYGVDVVFSGHIHRYTRSCPVFKGTCVGFNDDGTARGPVHLMTGNAGAPGEYYSYTVNPDWLEKEVFDFGFGELEVSKTKLTFSMITSPAPGKMEESDKLTLVKPEGWNLNRNEAKALYDSTPTTPYPSMMEPLFNPIPVMLSFAPQLPSLIEANPELAAACFGPQTELFANANSPFASEQRPMESWTYQATLLTFLNATYQPPTDPTPESMSVQYTVNYMLASLMGANKIGDLPPGCQ